MSFLKIKDPIKRDWIVEEFLKTKKNIQKKFITERLGDISAERELSKLFKPITETQKDIKESLVSELRPIIIIIINNNQYIYKQRQSHAMSQRRWLATAVIFRPSDVSLGFAGT